MSQKLIYSSVRYNKTVINVFLFIYFVHQTQLDACVAIFEAICLKINLSVVISFMVYNFFKQMKWQQKFILMKIQLYVPNFNWFVDFKKLKSIKAENQYIDTNFWINYYKIIIRKFHKIPITKTAFLHLDVLFQGKLNFLTKLFYYYCFTHQIICTEFHKKNGIPNIYKQLY